MSLTLHFEQPHFPPDTEFGIPYLGVIKNGGDLEIDENMERMFIAVRHTSIEDAFKNIGGYTVSGSSALSAEELQKLIPPAPAEEVAAGTEPAPTDQTNEDVANSNTDTKDFQDPDEGVHGV